MSIDISKIDKIDTNLVVPTTKENLIEIERDKWGNILNEQTFKTLNNNIKILKEVILNIGNTLSQVDIIEMKKNLDKVKDITNDLDTYTKELKTTIDTTNNDKLNIGVAGKKVNFVGNGLSLNDNELFFNDYAKLSSNNNFNGINTFNNNVTFKNDTIFENNVNTKKSYLLNDNKVIENDGNNNIIGTDNTKLNLKTTSDGVFNVNGVEFKGGSGLVISEIFEILISYKEQGDINPVQEIYFKKSYDKTPLLFTSFKSITTEGYNYRNYINYHYKIIDVNNKKFKFEYTTIMDQNEYTRVYVYVIDVDKNDIDLFSINLNNI